MNPLAGHNYRPTFFMNMVSRYINTSPYAIDEFFTSSNWLNRLMINDYQVVTIFWNIFLLAIPYLLAYWLIGIWKRNKMSGLKARVSAVLLFGLWLLFIPNTAYVMNEVRHLLNYCPTESLFRVCEQGAWFIMFFLAYSLVGWVSFYYLVEQMRQLVVEIFGEKYSWRFIIALMPVLSLGVLLGLLNRWNSWEFFIYPIELLKTVWVYFSDKTYFTNLAMFTIFMNLFYFAGRKLLRPIDFIKKGNGQR